MFRLMIHAYSELWFLFLIISSAPYNAFGSEPSMSILIKVTLLFFKISDSRTVFPLSFTESNHIDTCTLFPGATRFIAYFFFFI